MTVVPTLNTGEIGSIIYYWEVYKIYCTFVWVPSHIGIEGNELADQAADRAIKLEEVTTETPVPFSLIKRTIKSEITNKFRVRAKNIILEKSSNAKDYKLSLSCSLNDAVRIVLSSGRKGRGFEPRS